MKLLFYIICFYSLFGCSERTEGWKINTAEEFCKDSGGVDYIGNVLQGSIM